MFGAKLLVWLGLGLGLAYGSNWYVNQGVEDRNAGHFRQFDDDDSVPNRLRMDHMNRNAVYAGAVGVWSILGLLFFWGDLSRVMNGDTNDDRLLGVRHHR